MNLQLPLHPSRLQVLYALRHAPHARYTDLMRATGLESDVFKFHLRALTQNMLVRKNNDGTYSLTTKGKEFANNLDETSGQRDRSPKLSMIIIASSKKDDEDVYLFHQRHRNPFYGYWGFLSGPVIWGRSIEDSAKGEFLKQTGLSAMFRVYGFCRVRDYLAPDSALIEDKLFAIVIASVEQDKLQAWHGGANQWMTPSELAHQSKYFKMTENIFNHIEQGSSYFELDNIYSPDDY